MKRQALMASEDPEGMRGQDWEVRVDSMLRRELKLLQYGTQGMGSFQVRNNKKSREEGLLQTSEVEAEAGMMKLQELIRRKRMRNLSRMIQSQNHWCLPFWSF